MKHLKIHQANNIWEKAKGLIGTSQPRALLLKTRWGIHTFGMMYPIDVIVLNQTNTIVKLKENLQPNRIFLWNPQYDTIVELPEGFIQRNKLQSGEKMTISLL